MPHLRVDDKTCSVRDVWCRGCRDVRHWNRVRYRLHLWPLNDLIPISTPPTINLLSTIPTSPTMTARFTPFTSPTCFTRMLFHFCVCFLIHLRLLISLGNSVHRMYRNQIAVPPQIRITIDRTCSSNVTCCHSVVCVPTSQRLCPLPAFCRPGNTNPS